MKIENLLKPLFYLIVVLLSFEGGFYFGVNFPNTEVKKQESTQDRQNLPLSPLFSQMSAYQPKFKSSKGISVQSTPAIRISDWASFSYTLINSDSGSVKDASMTVVYQGKIAKLEKNTDSPFTQKIANNKYYLLLLENPNTGAVNSIYVDSNINNPGDYHVGDNVEIYKTLSLTDNHRSEQIKIIH